MKRTVLALGLLSGALFNAGCRTEPPPRADVPAQSAPAPAPAPAPVKAEAAAACRTGLGSGLNRLEGVDPSRRLRPALQVIAEHCAEALPELSRAARDAAGLGWQRRAELLGKSALEILPPTCATEALAGPALEVSQGCPPPEGFELAEPLLRDLDAGTYLYALALRERLRRVDALNATTDQVISNLVLAAALEGEARGAGKQP